eukprot:scaffold143315_cov25-Prasinocladus_malaysianus.AAC.1
MKRRTYYGQRGDRGAQASLFIVRTMATMNKGYLVVGLNQVDQHRQAVAGDKHLLGLRGRKAKVLHEPRRLNSFAREGGKTHQIIGLSLFQVGGNHWMACTGWLAGLPGSG